MASIIDSEEINNWFKNHGKHTFDMWNTEAQQAQFLPWCEPLSSDDAKQNPPAHSRYYRENVDCYGNKPQKQPQPSVHKFTTSNKATPLINSARNGLTVSNLNTLQNVIANQQFATSTRTPIIKTRRTDHKCHEHIWFGDISENTSVHKWLNKIPQTTEQRNSYTWSMAAGYCNQPIATTARAIEAYKAENEQALTEHESYRRQKSHDCLATREAFLQESMLRWIYPERCQYPLVQQRLPRNSNWDRSECQSVLQDEQIHNNEDREQRKSSRLTKKEKMKQNGKQETKQKSKQKKTSSRVRGADWSALGDRRRDV